MLYIQEYMMKPQVIHEIKELYNMRQQRGRNEIVVPTTWGADWDYFSTADHHCHTLCPYPCCLQEVSIITRLYLGKNLRKDKGC